MSFLRWLLTALWRFLLQSIAVIGALQAYNYLFGGDDDYKAWALEHRGEIAIGLFACLAAHLMYEWLRSNEP